MTKIFKFQKHYIRTKSYKKFMSTRNNCNLSVAEKSLVIKYFGLIL